MAAPKPKSFRSFMLAGSVAAITATGAWYGAGLKTRREHSNARTAHVEAPPEERIEQLEEFKGQLLQQKAELQLKIDQLLAKSETSRASPR